MGDGKRNQTIKKNVKTLIEIYKRKMCFVGCIAATLNSFNVNFCCAKNLWGIKSE